MRQFIWIAILAAPTLLMPTAYAQSNRGTMGGAYEAGPDGVSPPGFRGDQPNPTNCGTPDDPNRCGPMPRRALKTYPGPKPFNT
jgi:hypothetical protein